MSIFDTAPNWCPNAVGSHLGWHHPDTIELLVSVPGGVRFKSETVKSKPVLSETVEAAEVVEEVIAPITIDETVQGTEILSETVEVKQNKKKNTKKAAK